MDYVIQCRKLFQFATSRLVLVIGIIFGIALVLQLSTLPSRNVLSFLFPSRMISLFGRSISPSENLVNESSFEKVVALDRNNSTLENVRSSYDISISENTREPGPGLPQEQVKGLGSSFSLYSGQPTAMGPTLESVGSQGIGLSSVPPASPPVASLNNLNLLKILDANSTTSGLSVASDITSAKNLVPEMPSMMENPEVVGNAPVASNSNFKMNDNPMTRKRGALVTPISKLKSLLLQSYDSFNSTRPLRSSECDQELLFVKSQIKNASSEYKDPELCPSIFQNVSIFKRSYELMENILKIYIYKDGEKPIFHKATEPILKGIYASEGWFMRLMEKDKQFVVNDPRKAHLFYMPFSSRMLQLTLYVRNSHNRANLADYLKQYVDMIATKYPFWNRTGGADHFLVACHDWAPFETRHHMDNCIKVLCNANAARDFKLGKDVTLPETQVHKVDDPLHGLGGNLPSKRPILAFFAGGMHGDLRPILLHYWGNKDPDMKIFGQMPHGNKEGMSYAQYMKSSKYCICPRGYDVNSPRVVEAIFFECVPVFLSDNYVPPFFEVLDWEAFAVFVPERDIHKLKEILLSIPKEKYLEMQLRVKKVQKHFLWHKEPVKYDLFHMILHSVWFNRLNQVV